MHFESYVYRSSVRETKAARKESQKRKLKYARGLIDVVAPD